VKVAVVHGFYSSETPSGENAVVQMQIAALVAAGHEAKLFGVYSDDFRQDAAYKVRTAIQVSTGLGHDPTNDLAEFAPDVVHVHNLFPNFSTRWLAAWPGPLVTSLHNFRPLCASGNLFRDGAPCTLCPSSGQIHSLLHKCYKDSALATLPLAVRNRRGVADDPILRRADGIVFLSERAKNIYSDFGLDPSKSTIIPNFVEAAAGEYKPVSADAPWVFAGRLTPDKGIARLVEAWPSHVKLDVYGDGPEMEFLRVQKPEQVTFHGSVPRENVLRAVSKAQGVVIPSLWAEGLPTIYLEALAAGVPVLAKDGNSAADDVLVSGSGAVFREWDDVTHLVEAVTCGRSQFGQAALSRFSNHFTKAAWLSRIEALYGDVQVLNP
jgi:glycosyltransferase involved in cell wall biosynthesis